MAPILLTLQLPARGHIVPLATTSSPAIIAVFARGILAEYERRAEDAPDEVEALVYRAECSSLRRVLTLAVPDLATERPGQGEGEGPA